MDFIMKKKIWFWVLIVLVIINVAALLTIMLQRNIPQPNTPPRLVEDLDFRGMNYFLRHELNLSDEQFNTFQRMRRESMEESARIMIMLHEKRNEMLNELTASQPDQEKLGNLAKEMGDLHEKLKMKTFNHFLELKALCSPEQEKKLNRFFMDIRERNPHPRRNSPGFRHRQGKRMNRHFE